MKIFQINTVCGIGSTGRIATGIYDTLNKNGHECIIAYGRGESPEGYNTFKIGNKFSIYSHVFLSRVWDAHGFGSKNATKELIKKIDEYEPDIIQLHNIHGYYVNIEILFNYFSEKNIPVVWLLHDMWTMTGHGAYIQLLDEEKIPTQNTDIKQKFDYPKSYIDRSKHNYKRKEAVFSQVDNLTVITPSRWLANIVRKSYLSKYPTEVIHNGINLESFIPKKSNFRATHQLENKKMLLGVANVWNETKGLGVLNKLASDLDPSYKLVLVGVDNKVKKKIHKNILTINHTNSVEELAEIYSEADVLVNPTYEDNFPTRNIEALACGTPVITFDTGGSSEMLNAEVGKIVEQGNYESLLDTIVNFEYDKDLEDLCVKRARDFDMHNKFSEYVDLYDKIIEQTKRQ
jgi:glycosyltransferase involved in cell wall biosynthesis